MLCYEPLAQGVTKYNSVILSHCLFGHVINYPYLYDGALECLCFLKKSMRCAGVYTCSP